MNQKMMYKTTFRIDKMDCPSEVQLIKTKLAHVSHIVSLDFDLSNRHLAVFHSGSHVPILEHLHRLNLDTSLLESVPHIPLDKDDASTRREKTLLGQVLAINFFFFLLELFAGYISGSMGLLADSLDMLADTFVYGLALLAVGGSLQLKKNIARAAGYLQLILAFVGLSEVIRRFLAPALPPTFLTMIIISFLALLGNSASLYLLQKSKSTEAHLQASIIFTSNDVMANLGVIVAGVLVYLTDSKYPDLLIGALVFWMVARGAFKIMRLAK